MSPRPSRLSGRPPVALALLALTLGPIPACTGARRGEEPVHVVVLHTNDLHGQVLPRSGRGPDGVERELGGLPRLAAELSALRRELAGAADAVLVVDAGDWFQGTPEGRVDGGLGFLRAMEALDYDACAVGNHELDLGLAHLEELLGAVDLPAVCANVRDSGGEPVSWVAPYRVVSAAGLDVALVGLITVDTPDLTHADARERLAFEEPADVLARLRADPALEGVEWFLPITHQGVEADRRLARAHPDLPLVVGGHSHTFLDDDVLEGGVRVVQAGANARAIGRVDLWLDRDGRCLASEATLVSLVGEAAPGDADARVDELCADLALRADLRLAETVGELARPLERSRGLGSSPSDAWIADAMRRRTGADVAVHNRGGTRTDLPAGPVTRRDLFELVPFDNHLVTVTLSGAELRELLRASIQGRSRPGLEPSGLVIALDGGETPSLADVLVDGVPLDDARELRVTTNSFLAGGGDGYTAFRAGRERVEDPILLRELLELDLARERPLFPPRDARLVVGKVRAP